MVATQATNPVIILFLQVPVMVSPIMSFVGVIKVQAALDHFLFLWLLSKKWTKEKVNEWTHEKRKKERKKQGTKHDSEMKQRKWASYISLSIKNRYWYILYSFVSTDCTNILSDGFCGKFKKYCKGHGSDNANFMRAKCHLQCGCK